MADKKQRKKSVVFKDDAYDFIRPNIYIIGILDSL